MHASAENQWNIEEFIYLILLSIFIAHSAQCDQKCYSRRSMASLIYDRLTRLKWRAIAVCVCGGDGVKAARVYLCNLLFAHTYVHSAHARCAECIARRASYTLSYNQYNENTCWLWAHCRMVIYLTAYMKSTRRYFIIDLSLTYSLISQPVAIC